VADSKGTAGRPPPPIGLSNFFTSPFFLYTAYTHAALVCIQGRKVHALSVRQRVDFNVTTLVHQSLSGISPSYLAHDYRLVVDARERRLRSTVSRTCVVMQTYSTFGDRAFAAAGPRLRNSLPSHLKEVDFSYNRFRYDTIR